MIVLRGRSRRVSVGRTYQSQADPRLACRLNPSAAEGTTSASQISLQLETGLSRRLLRGGQVSKKCCAVSEMLLFTETCKASVESILHCRGFCGKSIILKNTAESRSSMFICFSMHFPPPHYRNHHWYPRMNSSAYTSLDTGNNTDPYRKDGIINKRIATNRSRETV
jgi:hypothetical protein